MPLPLRESQLATELADVLYDFLPGKPYPRASADLSFPGAAQAAYLSTPWPGGSKRPALTALLSATLEHERHRFCGLITEIVRRAMAYRANKAPLTREEIDPVNEILIGLQFKIPELHSAAFLDSLARQTSARPPQAKAHATKPPSAALLHDLIALEAFEPVPRGTAFERFLNDLFDAYGLTPRASFVLRGEQIDGSFTLDGEIYLLEARWEAKRTGNRDLAAFNDQVGARAAWTRGLFVSYAGYSTEGLEAFARGRSTKIICMDGFDLYDTLRRGLDLGEVMRAKARRAAEATQAFVPVAELFASDA
jgi:hypothetical protein